MKQDLIFTNTPGKAIDEMITRAEASSVFIITDDNTGSIVLPRLKSSTSLSEAKVITCPPGDTNKNIDILSRIWLSLSEHGATRRSIVVNVGGGMITDMGGFAAATFKRGIRFFNVPTTLLAAVDASVGGKTGINFNGCKNEIGAFAEPMASIISTVFFDTLPDREILSGYAEMLKHGLLDGPTTFAELLRCDPTSSASDPDKLLSMVEKSVDVKRRIVETDMYENGSRKALNLGHTVGHAFESLAMARLSPIPHGYAVAWGLAVELVLSSMVCAFPSTALRQYTGFVRDNFGTFPITCADYPVLLEFMSHDKKNQQPDRINFTLLHDAGQVETDQTADSGMIRNALDIYRDIMGI